MACRDSGESLAELQQGRVLSPTPAWRGRAQTVLLVDCVGFDTIDCHGYRNHVIQRLFVSEPVPGLWTFSLPPGFRVSLGVGRGICARARAPTHLGGGGEKQGHIIIRRCAVVGRRLCLPPTQSAVE